MKFSVAGFLALSASFLTVSSAEAAFVCSLGASSYEGLGDNIINIPSAASLGVSNPQSLTIVITGFQVDAALINHSPVIGQRNGVSADLKVNDLILGVIMPDNSISSFSVIDLNAIHLTCTGSLSAANGLQLDHDISSPVIGGNVDSSGTFSVTLAVATLQSLYGIAPGAAFILMPDLTDFSFTRSTTWIDYTVNTTGTVSAFYTAVPEPLSVAILGAGGALLCRRRK